MHAPAARAGRCMGLGPPGLHFPAGGSVASLPAAPRYACGRVRASVYFRPPRAEGRACWAAGAAGPAQPWTGSWGESGGRTGGPSPREGTRGAPRAPSVKGIRCGWSGWPAGAAPWGLDWGPGRRASDRPGGARAWEPLRRGRTRGIGTGSGAGSAWAGPASALPAAPREPAQGRPATPRRWVSGARGGRTRCSSRR